MPGVTAALGAAAARAGVVAGAGVAAASPGAAAAAGATAGFRMFAGAGAPGIAAGLGTPATAAAAVGVGVGLPALPAAGAGLLAAGTDAGEAGAPLPVVGGAFICAQVRIATAPARDAQDCRAWPWDLENGSANGPRRSSRRDTIPLVNMLILSETSWQRVSSHRSASHADASYTSPRSTIPRFVVAWPASSNGHSGVSMRWQENSAADVSKHASEDDFELSVHRAQLYLWFAQKPYRRAVRSESLPKGTREDVPI